MNISKLDLLIRRCGKSKVQVATECGITRMTLDNILAGRDTKVTVLESLAQVLGVDVGYFFQEDDIDPTATQGGSNNTQIAGNSNRVSTPASFDKAIDEIAAQRRVNEKSQEQIDRLITIIETMNAK